MLKKTLLNAFQVKILTQRARLWFAGGLLHVHKLTTQVDPASHMQNTLHSIKK